MKVVLLTVAVGIASLVLASLATPSGIAAAQSCTAGKPHPAVMTAARLHMWAQPIGYSGRDLAKGPIWDPEFPARPGQGETVVIKAHDVTPVPGYGKHGPFYRLPFMKKGDLLSITRCGVVYTYRFVRHFQAWQCDSKRVSMDPRRYTGELACFLNDAPIKQSRGGALYLRCCWPRYTDYKFFYVRLALIKTKPTL